jgi:hypothetical protein
LTAAVALTSTPRSGRLFGQLRLPRLAIVVAVVLMAVLAVERVWLALVQPLWFDEAWTAQVVATPDLSTFLRELYNDIQGPLYYSAMHLWSAVVGTSDIALRVPSLVALVVAGALPMAVRIEGLEREARLTWGVLVYAWWGAGALLLARSYAPQLAVSTLQCLLFARLLAQPSQANAWRWSAVAACAILLHTYALLAVAAQGLVFLAIHRRVLPRTWPALLAFVPPAGWIAYHATHLAKLSGMKAWHPLVTPSVAVDLTAFALNPTTPWVLAGVAAVMALSLLKTAAAAPESGPEGAGERAEEVATPDTHLWLTALAAAVGLAFFLLSGALQPVLTPRYLIPVVPGLLLGVVLCARRSAYAHLAYFSLMALFLGVALRPSEFVGRLRQGAPYGYETGSATLLRHGVTHVVFIWDHQATPIMLPASMERVGAVFFQRAGHAVRVTPLAPREGDDINTLALAAATGLHPGIIWVYNRDSPTASRHHPPAIVARDPRWSCERTGDGVVGSVACWRGGP